MSANVTLYNTRPFLALHLQIPIDRINIGYNKTNEEYIGLLEEKNKIKKDIERSKEYQMKRKIQDKEQGFNIHFSGANEERIREQKKAELLKAQQRAHSNSQQDQQQPQKVRRMWKNPNSSETRRQEGSQEGHPKYYNPVIQPITYLVKQFDLQGMDKKSGALGEKSPPKMRKRWNDLQNQVIGGSNQPTKAIHQKFHSGAGNEDEEYSDSFEDIPYDQDDQQENDEDEEKTTEAKQHEDQGQNDIEQFLRTATMKDIIDLRESLNNFQAVFNPKKMGQHHQNPDDEYIEEEFEEHIDSDNDEDDSEEEKRAEELRKQQQQQVLMSKNVASNKASKNRPISATFNLETSGKVLKQEANASQQFTETSVNKQQSLATVREEKPKYLGNELKNASSNLIQETPKQPNDFMKKPINTNPFKRPFSQNVPKRQDNKVGQVAQELSNQAIESQSKTSDQAFQSQQIKVPINQILQKIELLEEWQKEKLLEILDNLDNITSLSSSQNYAPNREIQQPAQNLDLKFLSPKKVENQNQPINKVNAKQKLQFSEERTSNLLAIKVLKTYGNPHLCGLTEIEIFDHEGKKVSLVPASIVARNMGYGPKMNLSKLIDGHKLTNEEKHMWIGYLPTPPQNLEILITLNKNIQIGGLKIWNYNKSATDCTRGVKEVQILINDEEIWRGILENGKGQTNVEYATFIPIIENIELPREIPLKKAPQIIQQAIEEVYQDEEESKDNIKVEQQQEMPEEMRKYRSELQMKQRPESTPFWLSTDQKIASSKANTRDQVRFQNQTQGRQRTVIKDDKLSQNTFELLDKYSTGKESSLTGGNQSLSTDNSSKAYPQSAVGSSRPHPLRDQQKVTQSQQQSAQNLIKPNAGMGGISGMSKQKQGQELGVGGGPIQGDHNVKQWTQPFSVQKQGQLQETSEAIKQAVNKVNMITNQQVQRSKNIQNNPAQVEESLDNLEFFRATNLGRLQNENESMKKSSEKPLRGRWGQSPAKGLQDSQLSASKHKGAHVVVKNPFPEQKQGQQKTGPQTQRRNIVIREDEDILDQFLNQGKKDLLKSERNIGNQMFQSENIQSLQIGSVSFNNQERAASQKSSLSPARDNKQPSTNQKAALSYEDKMRMFSDNFFIPMLPSGQKLQFNILSTWGDMNYVGLTGIEIFDIDGKSIKIEERNISACPPDINILPSYGGDPRTIDKLIDGNYFTNDDLHVWLTPFTAGEDHTISIDLGKRCQISMIRIWNYNKSRIHSYRGARLITCDLDGNLIFKGELQKAPGNLNDPENCCEIILFTDSESMLQKIDQQDWINEQIVQNSMEDTQKISQDVPSYLEERPMTATKKFNTAEIEEIQRQLKQQKPTSLFDERPQTAAIITGDQEEAKNTSKSISKKHQQLANQVRQMAEMNEQIKEATACIRGRIIQMNIVETWGDLFYVGLTGIEVLDQNGQPIAINVQNVTANPRDMNSIPGHGSDYRTLDKLFDRVNNTMDDHHMWLIPFNKGENHTITIDLGKQQQISGIRFYNYNKSDEDSLRGAKQIIIQVDKKYVTPRKGVTIRKAPGLTHSLMSMGQDIKLPVKFGWTTDQIVPMQRKPVDLGLFQEYELMNLPIGFLFRFNLYSTHGDFYYIGLNGIELFDQNGYVIKIDKIFAEPQGVHTLPGMESDIRIVRNLINSKNQNFDEQNMWLAPFKNTRSYSAATAQQNPKGQQASDQGNNQVSRIPNYVYIVFDEPKAISAVKLWNYSKTPARGVNEFEIVIDDKQVFRGYAKRAPEKSEFDKALNKDFSTVVLFTSDEKLVDKFKNNVNYDPSKQQSVMLINEKKVMNQQSLKQRPDEEFVAFNEMQRPTTMAKKF